jgi:hypothetical protein
MLNIYLQRHDVVHFPSFLVNHMGFRDVRSLEGGIVGYMEIDKNIYRAHQINSNNEL